MAEIVLEKVTKVFRDGTKAVSSLDLKVTDGEVEMRRNYALEPAEVDAGYVLTCQTLPLSDAVTVDFDA